MNLDQPLRFYPMFLTKAGNSWSVLSGYIIRVGQIQLLRQQIAHELTATAKYDSKYLFYTLKTLNEYAIEHRMAIYDALMMNVVLSLLI